MERPEKDIPEDTGSGEHSGEGLSHESALQITEEGFTQCQGSKAHKYLPKFRKFSARGAHRFALTWHWPAFFASFWWMLYRKLYRWALVAVAALIALYCILLVLFVPLYYPPLSHYISFFPEPYLSLFFLYFLSKLAWGMSGHYIYYTYAAYDPHENFTARSLIRSSASH